MILSIIGGMRKTCAAVFLFAAGLVAVAVFYSPLTSIGTPALYADNMPIGVVEGLCYPQESVVRVEAAGGEAELDALLARIDASKIKTVYTDDMVLVYAYCHRVCAVEQHLADGRAYNVMGAVRDGKIFVGAPILSGCY